MSELINDTESKPARDIASIKRVLNRDTGTRMYHVLVSDGDFIAVPCDEETDAAFDIWFASEKQSEDNERFIDALLATTPDDAIANCANIVNARLERVTDRISTDGLHVYIDNDTLGRLGLDETLEDHLVKLMALRASDPQADYDFRCYAAFTENLYCNVDPEIRGQLVSWMKKQDWLTFTEDGCLIGYRGAMLQDGVPVSIHEGPAVVDGMNVNGHVPNPDGSIVEMPRTMVQHDPAVGCAPGLHVGTYEYARGWARDVILTVKVDPRDVVSVPFECDASKVRVCRFEVIEHKVIERSDDNLDAFYDHPTSYGYDPDDWDGEELDDDEWDEDGYDADGYDADGYDRDGYDADGYDADGYDEDGYDADGYDADGYDRDGYNEYGDPRDDVEGDGDDESDTPSADGGDGTPSYADLVKMYRSAMHRR